MPMQFTSYGLETYLEEGQKQHDHEEHIQIRRKMPGRFGPEETGGHTAKDYQKKDDIFEM